MMHYDFTRPADYLFYFGVLWFIGFKTDPLKAFLVL
jgi:hypothetical protein